MLDMEFLHKTSSELDTERQQKVSKDKACTFKITKRRVPWTAEEDQAVTALVEKHGTGNWSLIAEEMESVYENNQRNGKQCRERWHNHLDGLINKDNWTEKEENILRLKHIEYGNRWSDISSFLPGRTDNSIKNHFYSKLRKNIRKIIKSLNSENLIRYNGVDPDNYNADRVYKIMKKSKLPYYNITKDSILRTILNHANYLTGEIGDSAKIRRKINSSDDKTASKDKLLGHKYERNPSLVKEISRPKLSVKTYNIIIDKRILLRKFDETGEKCQSDIDESDSMKSATEISEYITDVSNYVSEDQKIWGYKLLKTKRSMPNMFITPQKINESFSSDQGSLHDINNADNEKEDSTKATFLPIRLFIAPEIDLNGKVIINDSVYNEIDLTNSVDDSNDLKFAFVLAKNLEEDCLNIEPCKLKVSSKSAFSFCDLH